MFRKLAGWFTGLVSLFSALCFVMSTGDLLSGSASRPASTLVGLMIFFGGVTAATALAAFKLTTSAGIGARAALPAPDAPGPTVDIALEALILALAAKSAGRLTVSEVAVGCAVPLEAAERALDGLTQRGHADLEVTPDGDAVYVLRGFLTAEEKRETVDVIEHVRS